MENIASFSFVEHAYARRLLTREVTGVEVVVLALRHFLLGERYAKIVIERIPVGRYPLKVPAHPLLERLDLGKGRSRNCDQGHIALLEVDDAGIEVIGRHRAAWTTLLPDRAKHEMIDDQLAASVEEVGQGLTSLRSFKHIFLLQPDPGQFAPFGAHV